MLEFYQSILRAKALNCYCIIAGQNTYYVDEVEVLLNDQQKIDRLHSRQKHDVRDNRCRV